MIGLIELGEGGGGGVKISRANLISYFSVSGDSKQIDVAPNMALHKGSNYKLISLLAMWSINRRTKI